MSFFKWFFYGVCLMGLLFFFTKCGQKQFFFNSSNKEIISEWDKSSINSVEKQIRLKDSITNNSNKWLFESSKSFYLGFTKSSNHLRKYLTNKIVNKYKNNERAIYIIEQGNSGEFQTTIAFAWVIDSNSSSKFYFTKSFSKTTSKKVESNNDEAALLKLFDSYNYNYEQLNNGSEIETAPTFITKINKNGIESKALIFMDEYQKDLFKMLTTPLPCNVHE